jgi:hypothetical protein
MYVCCLATDEVKITVYIIYLFLVIHLENFDVMINFDSA